MPDHRRMLVLVLLGVLLITGCGSVEPTATSVPAAVATSQKPTVAPAGFVPQPTVTSATQTATTSPSLLPPTPTPTQSPAPTPTPLDGRGGSLIVFYSDRDGNPEIYVMNPDGSDQRRLTFSPFEDSSPDWSPDGGQIAFISDRDDPQAGNCLPDCMYQIYVINADGSGEHKLVDTEFRVLHPDWHPDGTKLSFDTEFNLEGNIYVVNTDGSGLQRLIEDGFWADWSSDGTQLVYASNRDGNVEIYVADADGSNQRRLTDNRQLDYFPAWSPDGRRIAFARLETKQIYVMNADGSDERQLPRQSKAENPSWSPDGVRIAFQSSSEGNFEIYSIHVEDALQGGESSGPRRLTENRATDLWPSWGPAPTSKPVVALQFAKSEQVFASLPTWKIGLGDLDGDGDLDAVLANARTNHSRVRLNDGSGTFSDSGQKLMQYGHGIDVGDLDGDLDLDLFLTSHSASRPSKVYLNEGQGWFLDSGQDYMDVGFRLDLADLDGDGDLDALSETIEATSIYLNDGAGRFALAEGPLAQGMGPFPPPTIGGDLDGDGDVDLFVKEEGVGYRALLNDGAGSFSEGWFHSDPTAMSIGDVSLGDVDHDGDLDAVVTNGHFQTTSHPALVLMNDGSGHFTDSGQRLLAVRNGKPSFGDLDGDGDLDLVLTDYEQPNQIWLNDGAGHYIDSGFRFGGGEFYRHAHLADLDGDSDLDIFLATFGFIGGPNEIWFNTTPQDTGVSHEEKGLYLGQAPPGLDVEVFAPGIVSIEGGKEYNITISPDLQEIIFTRRTPRSRDDRLWTSRLENGQLTMPELVPFTYDALETDACFAPDGSRLYFNSARPLPGDATASRLLNVWFVDRTETGWSDPKFVGPPLNDYRPVYFSIANDGTLYFTLSSPRGIYYAELDNGQYGEAHRLPDEINGVREVAHPAIAPDESYIVVDSAYEQGGRLVGSLYVSFRRPDGSWTKAASVHNALKASESDVYAAPRITPDGKYLFFEKYDRETDRSDIYWTSTDVIEKLRPTTMSEPVATDPTSACPPARGAGTVSPTVAIHSITFVVNGLEQVVRDGDTLQASPGDEMQVRAATICAGPFSGDGGEACVDFVPVSQSGQELVPEHGGTQPDTSIRFS